MAWLQLRVHSRYPEFVDEILQACGASAVSFIDAEDDPVLEPAPGETPLWSNTVTLGLFPEKTDLQPVLDALREQLPDADTLQVSDELVEDQDWVRVWLKDCPPLKFGERLWVCPHEKRVDEPGSVTLLLDPGLAFGTGTHPSTALCLEWLATHDVSDQHVLDFGCGSGILAIAAAKLGVGNVTAVDIDPIAVDTARRNAADNQVSIQTHHADADLTGPFDLVMANILAQPLKVLAPALTRLTRPRGALLLSGILARQADEILMAYTPFAHHLGGLNVLAERDGWVCIGTLGMDRYDRP